MRSPDNQALFGSKVCFSFWWQVQSSLGNGYTRVKQFHAIQSRTLHANVVQEYPVQVTTPSELGRLLPVGAGNCDRFTQLISTNSALHILEHPFQQAFVPFTRCSSMCTCPKVTLQEKSPFRKTGSCASSKLRLGQHWFCIPHITEVWTS